MPRTHLPDPDGHPAAANQAWYRPLLARLLDGPAVAQLRCRLQRRQRGRLRRPRRVATTLITAATIAALLGGSAGAATVTIPIGGEVQVNSYTTNFQSAPQVGVAADGDVVVVWESYGQDGSGDGVYAQRYNAVGVTQGSEFRVNTSTTFTQGFPSVGVAADGDFVIAWQSQGQEGAGYGVYAQRYDRAGAPQGREFRVNTTTTNAQSTPSVGLDADGDFVVAWNSGQDGSNFGVYAQRYDAAGVAQGGEFQVNSTTTNAQSTPSVGLDTDGDFVVAWTSYDQDGSNSGVYAQRYDRAGVAQGSEFRVNTYTTNKQNQPSVGLDADGDFVVVWESYAQDGDRAGVYAQRYTSAGVIAPREFPVNTFTASDQAVPSVGAAADGAFVVAWASREQDRGGYGIYAQRYDRAGVPQGNEVRVNTYTTDSQYLPSVGTAANGDFVVAWQSSVQDGSGTGVYAQRYNAAGVAQGLEFQVNTRTTGVQNVPSVALDADGDFVIAWASAGQDGSSTGVYAQRYDAAGAAQGSEFRVNTTTTDIQRSPSVALDADGDFVIAWESNTQDGSSFGVYAQRYDAAGVAQGSEFRVNIVTTSSQANPSVALDADGDFVIAWQSSGEDGAGNGVYAQRYNAAGLEQGGVFPVNSYTANDQLNPVVGVDRDGDFVIAWHSYGQDGSGDGVYAQRYTNNGGLYGPELQVNSYTTGDQFNSSLGIDADGDVVIAWQSYGQDGAVYGVYAQQYLLVPGVLVVIGSAPAEPATPGAFRVLLDRPAPADTTVGYTVATGSGAAIPGVDYQPLSGTVLVPQGATEVAIPVVVLDDAEIDPGETVTLTFRDIGDYTLGIPSTVSLTIGDDDQLPTATPLPTATTAPVPTATEAPPVPTATEAPTTVPLPTVGPGGQTVYLPVVVR